MKGKYSIKVSNKRMSFQLIVERNITIIRGNSGTGKSTLINMIKDYNREGKSSGVEIKCKVPCEVIEGKNWMNELNNIDNSIVFCDEGNSFLNSVDFANCVKHANNYFVLITRDNLINLPYSINSILEFESSFTKTKTKNIAVKKYKTDIINEINLNNYNNIITEDSSSGFEYFNKLANEYNIKCYSSNGNSNIIKVIGKDKKNIIVVDGAAFGPFINPLYSYIKRTNETIIYAPESFEWIILNSGVVNTLRNNDKIKYPYKYIDSQEYFSWERYFTDLLINLTKNTVLTYKKEKLNDAYLIEKNYSKIKKVIFNNYEE